MHWASNIFEHSAATIVSFWVSVSYSILNSEKTACQKKSGWAIDIYIYIYKYILYLLSSSNEKIIEYQGNNHLTKRSKIISKRRHKNKFKLTNHETWPLCRKELCFEIFIIQIFPRISFWYGHLNSKSRYLLRMWRNLHQNGNTFHAMDVRLFLRYSDITVG